ncbi:hypothetical protein H2200_003749 [Cladophialophora chaetospira]|uniref:Uncharacterized protein n=1 Tax=Cladophialophora chaetospira TaxID=386627 RepID=A0AA38XEX7_9EURO|nr:hypothetical protein H2200_003749 [Cladophialophora chaetospira]
MVPLAALIILSAVVLLAVGTFAFAIYWTIKSRLEDKKLKDSEADSELRTPLTATSTAPGLFSRNPTPPPPIPPVPRPPTPEADFPPPLPDDTEDQPNKQEPPRLVVTAPPGPYLLPATTYRPPPASEPPPTPRADSPPPLPKDFPGRVPSPLPPHSPLLPSPPLLTPSIKDFPKPGTRPHGTTPKQPPPVPMTKPQERPDSMHEIYDIYSQLPPTPKPAPKSAPAHVASFAQAESKWAYFGQKRAESRDREQDANMV